MLYNDSFLAVSELITEGPSKVIKIYSSSTAAREDASFFCKHDPSLNVLIHWFRGSTLLSNSPKYMIESHPGNSTLTIFNVTIDDEDGYECNASFNGASLVNLGSLSVIGELQSMLNIWHLCCTTIVNSWSSI